ncbi:MAG: hypothetical protein Q9207_008329, partial [Kuettlingeria erythrocarpa]
FLPIFQSQHPGRKSPGAIQFRLRLLQFTYVFTRRRRHLSAISSGEATTPPCRSNCEDSKTENAQDHYQSDVVTLPETLPLFLSLSAAQNALQESTITKLWMRLAAGYMAQAFAAEVLVHGNNHQGLLQQTFRWGFDPNCDAKEGSDAWLINDMFDADYDVLSLWEDIKDEHMRALQPPDGAPLATHLKTIVSGGLSISTFNDKIAEFLLGLLCAHPKPLLTQLESGKVDDLSRRATATLKKRAGFV